MAVSNAKISAFDTATVFFVNICFQNWSIRLIQHSVHRYKERRKQDGIRCELDSVKDDSAKIIDAEAIEKSVEVARKKTDVNK